MLVIKLQRRGKKNQSFFRIVVIDRRTPVKAGVSVEELGYINPLTKEKSINAERAKYWVSVGAQPSDTVFNLLVSEGIIDDSKRKIKVKPCKHPEKKKGKEEAPAKQEEVKEEAAPAEEPKEVEKPEEEAPKEEPKAEEPKEEEPKPEEAAA